MHKFTSVEQECYIYTRLPLNYQAQDTVLCAGLMHGMRMARLAD